jgi:hypothetical protein
MGNLKNSSKFGKICVIIVMSKFRAKFKKKLGENTIVISKRIKVVIDNNSVIKNVNNEVVSVNDLQRNDHLNIEISDTNQVLSAKILPPRNV